MEFVMDCLKVNEKGNIEIGGCDVKALAEEYGTPAYIMDENTIRENCRRYTGAIRDYYGGNGMVLYASKALSCMRMYKIMKEEGMGADVVSGGELYTALRAGFPAEKIYFHGNNKSESELKYALESGVGRIVVDNRTELDMLERLSEENGRVTKILFRIKPGVDAHTHSFVRTGQIDSKFGVALETGEAEEIIKYADSLKYVKTVGLHCHIGSQIFELEPFEAAAEIMMNFIGDMKDKYGIELDELDLGGGFGIKYISSDRPVEYERYMKAVSAVISRTAAIRGVKVPFVLLEPGRSIVASAGLTVYRVGAVKEIPNIRTYVSVDGGMGDNPRFILYNSEYDAVLVERPRAMPVKKVTIVGKCCESGDVLIENIPMPEIKSGDLLAVLATGAYNYSMASNYNRIPRPPVILTKNGRSKLAVRRETYEDLVRNDM